jgi:CHRD domain
MKRTIAVLLTAVVGLAAVGIAVAGLNDNWSPHLNGDMEVPVRDTNAQGQAIFHLSDDGTSIDYKLIASNIENVFQAHIHHGAAGVNGPVVVWLYPSTTPGAGPTGGGRTDGVLATGTITSANFVSDLAGQPMSTLVDWLNTGQAYVNVHTSDGVLPTNSGPGDFPGGEIRGDVN